MLRGSSLLAVLAAIIHPDSSPVLFLGECSLSSSLRPRQASSSAMPRPSPGCLLRGLSVPATRTREPAELEAWQQVANTLQMEDTKLYSHHMKHRNIRLSRSSRRHLTEGRSDIVPVRRGCQPLSSAAQLRRNCCVREAAKHKAIHLLLDYYSTLRS